MGAKAGWHLPLCRVQGWSVPSGPATGFFSLFFQKNKPKVVTLSTAPVKEEKKAKTVQKQQGGNHQVAFSKQVTQPHHCLHVEERHPLCSCVGSATFFFNLKL